MTISFYVSFKYESSYHFSSRETLTSRGSQSIEEEREPRRARPWDKQDFASSITGLTQYYQLNKALHMETNECISSHWRGRINPPAFVNTMLDGTWN